MSAYRILRVIQMCFYTYFVKTYELIIVRMFLTFKREQVPEFYCFDLFNSSSKAALLSIIKNNFYKSVPVSRLTSF